MTATGDAIMWDVLEEHLDEAAFLFEMREQALDSPLYVLDDLITGPEDRLLAHIDGLVIGGREAATNLLAPVLDDSEAEDPTRAAAAALALLALSPAEWVQPLLDRVAALPDVPRRGVVAALSIAEAAPLDDRLRSVWERADPEVRRVLLPVLAARAIDPGRGLDDFLRDDDPIARAHALMAARHGDRARYLGWIEHSTGDPDPEVAAAALASGVVLGSRTAWGVANALVTKAPVPPRDPMIWAAMFGEPAAVPAIAQRLDGDAPNGDALFALGFSGRVEAADLCLRFIDDKAMNKLAAEAFVGITGLPRDEDEYWIEPPVPTPDEIRTGIEADLPPVEEEEQELASAPEEDLPVPNADAFRRWWGENRSRLDPRHRYVLGMPATTAALVVALRREPLRRRHALAFELAARTKGQAGVRTRSFGEAQRRQLAVAAGMPPIDGNRPFSRIG